MPLVVTVIYQNFRFGEEKKIETLDIILKATAEKTEKASSFLSGLKRLVYSSLVIDLSKVGNIIFISAWLLVGLKYDTISLTKKF